MQASLYSCGREGGDGSRREVQAMRDVLVLS